MLQSSEPSKDVGELTKAAEEIGFPIFVKAVAGVGGRACAGWTSAKISPGM